MKFPAGTGTRTVSYLMDTSGSLTGRKGNRIVNLTTHLHLMKRLRTNGAGPPIIYVLLWFVQEQFREQRETGCYECGFEHVGPI